MYSKLLETSTLPPFLFRAASHLSHGLEVSSRKEYKRCGIKDTISRGINTADLIDPLDGYAVEYHEDIGDIDSTTFKHMLRNHINYENKVASEFSSWSVSLLYALVHAVRKMYNEKDELLIYVMDTSKLDASRIFNARDLLRMSALQAAPNLMDYALGEYLIHGRLINTGSLWKAVQFEALINAGLWDSFPELNDRQGTDLLKARVGQLRSANFYTKPVEISRWQLESLYEIANCFGNWNSIVIMALTTFRRRYTSEDLMTNLAYELRSMGIEVPKIPLFCAVHLVVQDVPEVSHFYEVVRIINETEASHNAPPASVSSDGFSESEGSEEESAGDG